MLLLGLAQSKQTGTLLFDVDSFMPLLAFLQLLFVYLTDHVILKLQFLSSGLLTLILNLQFIEFLLVLLPLLPKVALYEFVNLTGTFA